MYCPIHDAWPYCETCLAEEERERWTDEDGYYGPRRLGKPFEDERLGHREPKEDEEDEEWPRCTRISLG